MATIFSPLVLTPPLLDLPQNYSQIIITYGADEGIIEKTTLEYVW